MNKLSLFRAAAVAAALAGAAVPSRAWGGPRPLTVVVESTPETDIGPRDVRQVISAELGNPVLGPAHVDAGDDTDLLVVTLDRTAIRMSFHAAGDLRLSRAIAAPPDRGARLRAVAWLAGNLVRDQVSPLVTTAPPVAPVVSPIVATAAPPPAGSPEPPTVPPPLSAPPRSAAPAAPVEAFAGTAALAGAPGDFPRWTLTASSGLERLVHGDFVPGSTLWYSLSGRLAYQLALQRQSAPGATFFGGVVEMAGQVQTFGIAGFAGKEWRRRRWLFEATAGAGVEWAPTRTETTSVTNSSASGPSAQTTVTEQTQKDLYVRGAVTGGLRLWGTTDLVLGLIAHLSVSSSDNDFGVVALGIRTGI
jgi:hypothetical protein